MASESIRSRLRDRRLAAGLTQADLATRAEVSRQLVAAVEAGQHAPGVGAALGLARAMGTTVEDLFASDPAEVVSALGDQLRDGTPLRVGRVGDRLVAAAPAHRGAAGDRWAAPDGILEDGALRLFPGAPPSGFVLAGCDPALGVAEALLQGLGPSRLLALSTSTGTALRALEAGRIHAAVVHGPGEELPSTTVSTVRLHLARWQVGLALPERLGAEPLEGLQEAGVPIVQREPTAASQQAFERAVRSAGVGVPVGLRAGGHLDAARMAATLGCGAVTTESAAAAFGLSFRALEEHTVQIRLAEEWAHLPAAQAFANLVASTAFTDRVSRFGGYDLSGCGTRVA